MIDRLERKVIEREAKAAAGRKALAGQLELSSAWFEPMEKKVAEVEALAKISVEKILSIPAVDINTMSIHDLQNTLIAFRDAASGIEDGHAELVLIREGMQQALEKLEANAEVWRERELKSEQAKNVELAHQARLRKESYMEMIEDVRRHLKSTMPEWCQ